MKTLCALVVGTACLLVIDNVRAGPVTWEFSGVVTAIRDDLGLMHDAFDGAIDAGSGFAGAFTFDDAMPVKVGSPSNPRYGYLVASFTGLVGTVPLTLASTDHDSPLDTLVYTSGVDNLIDLHTFVRFPYLDRFYLIIFPINAQENSFLSGDPPITTIEPGQDLARFRFVYNTKGEGIGMVGSIFDLHVVPEPGTLTLLLAGMAVTIQLSRRRTCDRR